MACNLWTVEACGNVILSLGIVTSEISQKIKFCTALLSRSLCTLIYKILAIENFNEIQTQNVYKSTSGGSFSGQLRLNPQAHHPFFFLAKKKDTIVNICTRSCTNITCRPLGK